MKAQKQIPALRLALLPILSLAIAGLEVLRPFGWFRLVSFLLLFVLLADLASLLRGRLRDLMLVASSLVLGVSLVELAGHYIFASRPTVTATPKLAGRQPVMGWGPISPGRFHVKKTYARTGKTIYNVVYTINSHLLRETKSCDTCATIAFFGDSFTFGEGLNDTDTLPQIFANDIDRKMRIVNLGYSAYGPQQFLREEQTGRFDKVIGAHPKLFVFLTAPWHAQRTGCKAEWVMLAPRYILKDGKLVHAGSCLDGRSPLWPWAEHSAAYRAFIEPFFEKTDHEDIEVYIRILLAATKLAHEKYGVPTIILFMNARNSYLSGTGFTNDEIVQRLRDGGALVVDASLTKEEALPSMKAKLHIVGDGHPTGLANQFRAAILKHYIEQNFASILQPPLRQSSGLP